MDYYHLTLVEEGKFRTVFGILQVEGVLCNSIEEFLLRLRQNGINSHVVYSRIISEKEYNSINEKISNL